MKTLIFLFFTYITYVLSSVAGPLGFAAKMPPFESSRHKTHSLKHQSISGLYDQNDLLLFLVGGYTGECAIYLEYVCQKLKEVYETVEYFGQGLKTLCDDPGQACKTYLKSKEELCDYNELKHYKHGSELTHLNSTKCHNIYIKCRFRSASCSSAYRDYCRNLLALCNDGYRRYELQNTFVDLAGYPTDPEFMKDLEEACSKIYSLSDGFVQYCLDYDWLKSDLKWYQELEEKGSASFKNYPDLSTGALLDYRELDGNLFTPRTTSPLDSEYMMAFLVGRTHNHEPFEDKCRHVSKKCLGLGFFPQTKYFCKLRFPLPKADSCGNTQKYIIKEEIPKLKEELYPLKEIFGSSLNTPYRLKVDVEKCLKYVGPCSYLRGLDLTLTLLCKNLESQCAQALETGSALSIFELSMRGHVPLHEPVPKPDPCELRLREKCKEIANDTADFLAFCLEPEDTCMSLRALYRLRCQKIRDSFRNPNPTEKECEDRLHEYRTYVETCGLYNNYYEFTKACITRYPSNKIMLTYMNAATKRHERLLRELGTGRGDS